MSSTKVRAIVKSPDEKVGHITYINNSLKDLQDIVDGYIETVTVLDEDPTVVIICNEDGRIMDMPYNCTISGIDFVGTIIAVGVNGDEFADIPSAVTLDRWDNDFLELINGRLVIS